MLFSCGIDSIQSPLISGPVSVIHLSPQGVLMLLFSQRSPGQGSEAGEGWSGIRNSTL